MEKEENQNKTFKDQNQDTEEVSKNTKENLEAENKQETVEEQKGVHVYKTLNMCKNIRILML